MIHRRWTGSGHDWGLLTDEAREHTARGRRTEVLNGVISKYARCGGVAKKLFSEFAMMICLQDLVAVVGGERGIPSCQPRAIGSTHIGLGEKREKALGVLSIVRLLLYPNYFVLSCVTHASASPNIDTFAFSFARERPIQLQPTTAASSREQQTASGKGKAQTPHDFALPWYR